MTSAQAFRAKWKTNRALFEEALGRKKYRRGVTALCELISNSLDAGATETRVTILRNELRGVEELVIEDNGIGMSRTCIEEVFADVGNQYKRENPTNPRGRTNIGKLGVGRFGVFRLGTDALWKTFSRDEDGTLRGYEFLLTDSPALDDGFDVRPLGVSAGQGSAGTRIEIGGIRQGDLDPVFFDDAALSLAVFSAFALYLTRFQDVELYVNGRRVEPQDYIEREETEDIHVPYDGESLVAHVTHVLWKADVGVDRDAVLVLCSEGRMVTERVIGRGFGAVKYAAYVESPTIDDLIVSGREELQDMDPAFSSLLENIRHRCEGYLERVLEERQASFIDRARAKPYYPYSNVSSIPEAVEQLVYDQFLVTVNREIGVERVSDRHQRLIFRLLKRAVENHDLLKVLDEVSSLSDEETKAFRELLEQVTLSSVIQVSSMLADRVAFLENLRELVYSDDAKFVRERCQLHKLMEAHTWLFGEQFNLAASDRTLRDVVAKHRKAAGLTELMPEALETIRDGDRIPDLFLTSTKLDPFQKRHHHLIVELKAPRVSIGRKELTQVKDYAMAIVESPQFDKAATEWEFVAVSTDIQEKVRFELIQSRDRRSGCSLDRDDCRIFVRRWSELIDERQAELDFATGMLRSRTQDIEELGYFRKKYRHLLPAALQEGRTPLPTSGH